MMKKSNEVQPDRNDCVYVRSETDRSAEGHPEVCWMDIDAEKLRKAKDKNCILMLNRIVADFYLFSYRYCITAGELLKEFEKAGVKPINKKQGEAFRFYLHFRDGDRGWLRKTLAGEDIIELEASGKNPQLIGREALFYAMKALSKALAAGEKGNILQMLVARTAVWAPEEGVRCRKEANFVYRRKRPGEKDVSQKEKACGIKPDDNTHPNRIFKAALRRYYGLNVAPHEYEVCHIWEGSCYDPLYHTRLSNLVMIPRAIASLSDYDEGTIEMLKHRADHLFSEDTKKELKTKRPSRYPREKCWLDLKRFISRKDLEPEGKQ